MPPKLSHKETIDSLKHKWAHYRDSPADYVQDIILPNRSDGVKLLPYQADILDAVARWDWVALRAANGIGKDSISAWLLEWFLLTRENSKVPCTSGVARQLKEILFSEVHKYGKQSIMAPFMRFMDMAVRVKGREKEWFALGFTAAPGEEGARESKTEGFHGENLMFITTESKAIPDYVWVAIRKACTMQGNKIFAQSVPGTEYGEFFKIFASNRDSWRRLHFPAAQRIVTPEGVIWKPNTPLVSEKSINEKLSRGEGDPEFQASVLAEFIKQSDDCLIPMDWIRGAINLRVEEKNNDIISYGVDPARFGHDDTAIVKRRGRKVVMIETWNGYDAMKTCDLVKSYWDQEPGKIYVDAIGVGGPIVDRLQQMGVKNVIGVNVSNTARNEDKYPNLRSELWFNLRDLLNPKSDNRISLPDNEKLVSQLSTIHYDFKNTTGQQFIEPKSKLKDSPDVADALCLAFFDVRAVIPEKGKPTEINYLREFLLKPTRKENLVGIMGLPG